MIAATFLLGSALLGVGLSERALGSRINPVAHWCFGLVLGWCLTTAVAYAIACVAGQLSSILSLSFVAGTWLLAMFVWLPRIRSPRAPFSSLGASWPLLLLLTLLTPLFNALFRTHMLQPGAEGALYSGGTSTAYDIAFHAALTNSFLYGGNFPPLYPAMPPAALLYPALPDFQTALLISLGLDLHAALVWTGVALALALTAIFYSFVLSLARNRDGSDLSQGRLHETAALATVLFLCNGGLGFIYFLQDWSKSGLGSLFKMNYSNLPERGIVWPNLITDMLLSQRTTLFGLSLGLIVFTLFALAWREMERRGTDSKWSGWRVLLFAGLVAGLLPRFHPHSFGAVGIVSVFLFILRPRRVWLVFWGPAILLAAPYLASILHHVMGEGFVRFRPGWRGPNDVSWFPFWLWNAGLPTLLIIPAWFAAPRSLRSFYLAFAGLLVASLLVIFSPNDYDNLKLMTYWQAATVIVVANWLVCLTARSRMLAIPVVLVVLASIASGTLAVVYELRSRTLVFDRNEVAAAEFVRSQTPPRSLFLTSPSLHQPVLTLAGRAIVRGPTSWLWSHGYSFAEREADVRAIYAGRGDALELLRYYRVDYVYLGPRERTELKANQEFFDRTFPVAYQAADILVYDVRQPGIAPDSLAPYPTREFASRVGVDPYQPLVEFREIGYPLYRQLAAVLGRPPRYQEFMDNLKTIGQGVYPGRPGWRDVLETNRRQLTEAGTIANSDGQSTDDYNGAYVRLHYFGYLKRDVEADAAGYQFWLNDLNHTGDYRSLTRAFIESEEYKAQAP